MSTVNATVDETIQIVTYDLQERFTFDEVSEGAVMDAPFIVAFLIPIREIMRVRGTLEVNHHANMYLTDTVQIAAALFSAIPVTVAEGVLLTPSLQAQRAVAIIEGLRLADLMTPAAAYQINFRDTLRLTESLQNFFGASVTEGIALSDVIAQQRLAIAAATETIQMTDVIAPTLLMHVSIDEGVEVADDEIVRMLFNPTIFEGVEITGGYVEPNGSITTWVMNARNNAVTEYRNYAFNSFAEIGGKYVGASEDGLFELLGDDDDGASIIARIKGGYMQFGGTHLSRLSAAYIAARGEGNFVLRIIAADGVTYNYATSTRNMRSTKFHMGKGQRSRYFAFELISAGQDFDLDTLEFVPLVVQRRV